jgi:hypothetical protein
MRQRIEAGERFDMEYVLDACVTLDEALSVFSGTPRETPEAIYPVCCGTDVKCNHGLFVGTARCEACGAEIRDVLSPLSSPILERGNSWVSTPSDKLIERVGKRHWLVMHEGAR